MRIVKLIVVCLLSITNKHVFINFKKSMNWIVTVNDNAVCCCVYPPTATET
jgi:hypothetical protein